MLTMALRPSTAHESCRKPKGNSSPVCRLPCAASAVPSAMPCRPCRRHRSAKANATCGGIGGTRAGPFWALPRFEQSPTSVELPAQQRAGPLQGADHVRRSGATFALAPCNLHKPAYDHIELVRLLIYLIAVVAVIVLEVTLKVT